MDLVISVESNEPLRGRVRHGEVSQTFVGWISLLGILADLVEDVVLTSG